MAEIGKVVLKLNGIVGPIRTGAEPVDYTVSEDGVISLIGDTTSLDDRSTLWLDLEVQDTEGKGLRIDLDPRKTPKGQVNHPEFLGLQHFVAEDVETGELLGSIGGDGLDDMVHYENGVSFVPQRYNESGGMAANARLKRKGGPIRIYAEVDGVESKSFITPEVR